MPQFIKMGLGGTGYIGKKESFLRAARKRAARRKVLPGYPIESPFRSIKEVREYLSGDCLTCLLCGKTYRDVSKHITKIHGITPDQYREKYNIPWTFGVVGMASSKAYSESVKKRMSEGWEPPMKFGDEQLQMVHKKRRKEVHKREIGIDNLSVFAKPKHPLTVNPETGLLETFTAKRERLTTKRGTEEHRIKMASRPQVEKNIEILKKYWIGKKQTEEHKRKRFAKKEPK